MTAGTTLLARIAITESVTCDVCDTPTGVRAQLHVPRVDTFYQRHKCIDLTERDLREILDAVSAGNRAREERSKVR